LKHDLCFAQAVQTELGLLFDTPARPTSRSNVSVSSGTNWKYLQVIVQSGDLLASSCDAIVNSTSQFNLTGIIDFKEPVEEQKQSLLYIL